MTAFIRSTASFILFLASFIAVSSVSITFILPLLTLSFIFSSFVILFSGLSYLTFRIASSNYNHTVLFLTKLLRKLADSIPPSVGLIEVDPSSRAFDSHFELSNIGFPSFKNIKTLMFSYQKYIDSIIEFTSKLYSKKKGTASEREAIVVVDACDPHSTAVVSSKSPAVTDTD